MTERRRTADAPRVIVVDIGVDAALYSEPGNRVLVLRPGQTFNNAVAAAQRCLPDSHPDTIRTIVRTNLPGAPDFDPPEAVPARRSDAEAPASLSRWRWRWPWRRSLIPLLAAALAVVAVGMFGVVRAVTGQPDGPFDDEAFVEFARRGEFVCTKTGELQATCTDPRGGVLVSEATVGPRSVVYMFSYGEERVGLRVFADAKSARAWANTPPTLEMYQNVRAEGRFVLWGTEVDQIAYYLRLLKTPANSAEESAGRANDPVHSSPSALPVESGEPVVLAGAGLPAESAAAMGRLLARVPPPEPSGPSSDGLPASLGAVMMATLGVGAAEADRAAEDGLERALPAVQVVAVKLTLGMPGSDDAEPGDAGPSDDAPIDVPTDEPTDAATTAADGAENAPDAGPTPTPPTGPEPTPTPTSEPSQPAPTGPIPGQPEPQPTTQSSPPTESPAPTESPEPTGSPTPTESPTTTQSPEPTSASSESPESTSPSEPAPAGSAPPNSAPPNSAPSDGAPSDTRTLPAESPLPTAPDSTSSSGSTTTTQPGETKPTGELSIEPAPAE